MGNILFINHSEQTLLERLRKNDSVAQRQLFDTYQKKLLTVCFRYLNDEDEALDALNRSFLKICFPANKTNRGINNNCSFKTILK